MPAMDVTASARDAIDAFIGHLAERELAASTRRIRRHYLSEYLRHAQQAATAGGVAGPPAGGNLMGTEGAQPWLPDAAAGKTRTRNTLRGPEAAAYPNSMRVRIDSVKPLAGVLGEARRAGRPRP